jgi:hypothetical protein
MAVADGNGDALIHPQKAGLPFALVVGRCAPRAPTDNATAALSVRRAFGQRTDDLASGVRMVTGGVQPLTLPVISDSGFVIRRRDSVEIAADLCEHAGRVDLVKRASTGGLEGVPAVVGVALESHLQISVRLTAICGRDRA